MRKVEKIYILLTYVRVRVYHSNSPCPQRVCAAWTYKTDWNDGLVKNFFLSRFVLSFTLIWYVHISFIFILVRFHLDHSFVLIRTRSRTRFVTLDVCNMSKFYFTNVLHDATCTHTLSTHPQYSHSLIRGHSRFTKSLFSVLSSFLLFSMFVLIFIFIFNVLCTHEQDCARQIHRLCVRSLAVPNAQHLMRKQKKETPNANECKQNNKQCTQ